MTDSGRRSARYAILPSLRRPRLVVPRRPLRVAAAAVRKYNTGATGRERIGIMALAAAVRFGLADALPGRLDDGGTDNDIRAHLAKVLDRDIEISVYIGPARAVRKPVVQLLDRRATTIAFAKLGLDDFTRALVRTEAAALTELAAADLHILSIPQPLHHGQWNGAEVLVLGALRRGGTARPDNRRLGRAMDELARSGPVETDRLGTTDYLRELDRRLQAQPISALTARLRDSLGLLGTRFGETIVDLGAWHGDWTLWNMTVVDDRISVWDWEKYETGKPIGFDAVHYAVHWTMAVGGASAREAFADTLRCAPELLKQHGIDAEDAALVVWLYVIELAVRYHEDREMDAGSTALSRMTEWLPPVLEVVEQRTRQSPS